MSSNTSSSAPPTTATPGEPPTTTVLLAAIVGGVVSIVLVLLICKLRKHLNTMGRKPPDELARIHALTDDEASLMKQPKRVAVSTKTVLLVGCCDDMEQQEVLLALSAFLQKHCACFVTQSFNPPPGLQEDYRVWVREHLKSTQKVIIVNSERAYSVFKSVMLDTVGTIIESKSRTFPKSKMFAICMEEMRRQCQQMYAKDKIIMAHFGFTRKADLIKELSWKESIFLYENVCSLYGRIHKLDLQPPGGAFECLCSPKTLQSREGVALACAVQAVGYEGNLDSGMGSVEEDCPDQEVTPCLDSTALCPVHETEIIPPPNNYTTLRFIMPEQISIGTSLSQQLIDINMQVSPV